MFRGSNTVRPLRAARLSPDIRHRGSWIPLRWQLSLWSPERFCGGEWTAAGPQPGEMRLEITTPATTDPVSLAISPDGEKLVFVASAGGPARLWLRPFNATTARPLAGTEHASLPFWSPDSRSIGFFADDRVKRIDIESGRVEELARALVPAGGTWNQDGVIVYSGTIDSPLRSVSSDGSGLGAMTELATGQTGHRAPQFLPDGRHFIYFAMGSADVRGVHVGDAGSHPSRRLFDADTPAVYAANHLFYVHQGTLIAQRFIPSRLELEGDPAPIAEHVTSGTRADIAALVCIRGGPIAYRTGSSGGKRQFVWFDREGREVAGLEIRTASVRRTRRCLLTIGVWRCSGRMGQHRHLVARSRAGHANPFHDRSGGGYRSALVAGRRSHRVQLSP